MICNVVDIINTVIDKRIFIVTRRDGTKYVLVQLKFVIVFTDVEPNFGYISSVSGIKSFTTNLNVVL